MSEQISVPITKENLPEGLMWQADGACFKAVLCDPTVYGCEWRWQAMNLKAFEIGEPTMPMFPHHPFIGIKRRSERGEDE